jgi:hypothetical protein
VNAERAGIVSRLPTRTFNDGPLRGSFRQTYHAYACIGLFLVSGIHRGRQQQRISPKNDGRISFIHDYRYVRYVTADAELTLAAEANPAEDDVAQ